MVSSAIWKKTCKSEFFKDYQNCTSPKDDRVQFEVFDYSRVCANYFKLYEKPCYYLLITET
jgi:hypothetical protein